VPGFFVFAVGGGLGGDAAADGELPVAAGGGDGADEDAEVQGTVEAEIAEGAAIGAAGGGFELGDDLHGPDFGGTGDGAAGESGADEIDGGLAGGERAFDGRDEVLDELVGFEAAKLGDADAVGLADAGEIVAEEIDDHHVFGAVFFALEEIVAGEEVGLGPGGAAAGAFDGAGFDLAILHANKSLRGGADDLTVAEVEPGGEGGGVALAEAEVE